MGLGMTMPRTGGLKSFEHALYDRRCTGEVLDALCYFADRAQKQRVGFVEGHPFDNVFFTRFQHADVCEGVRLYRHCSLLEQQTPGGPERVSKVVRDLLTGKNEEHFRAAESTVTFASSLLSHGHSVELVPEVPPEKRPDLQLRVRPERWVFVEMKAMHCDDGTAHDLTQRLVDQRLAHQVDGDLQTIPSDDAGRTALVERIEEAVVRRGGILCIPGSGWVAPAANPGGLFRMGPVPADCKRLLQRLSPQRRRGREEEPEYGPQLRYGEGLKVLAVRTTNAFSSCRCPAHIGEWCARIQQKLMELPMVSAIVVYEDSPMVQPVLAASDGVSYVQGFDPDDGYGRVALFVDSLRGDVPKPDPEERRVIIDALVHVPSSAVS